ncbi:MAG TPA: MoxR family ATPase [Thermoanaerobaculia bacterium]|nr:MoxR family ATPase [Thermoanaerobaculia bacterium]
MRYLSFDPGHHLRVEAYGTLPETVHVFDGASKEAINAALAAGRPLLVRGEPGTGKSQLARAAAAALGRAFLPFTVDARTEARDLLYTVDTVARLAEAQIVGHLPRAAEIDVREYLDEERFTTPGPIWWVFEWESAERQAERAHAAPPWTPKGWSKEKGAVLLIDEIDKADPAVPNGLLEALGQGQFRTPWGASVASPEDAPSPLVVLTTNEERALPDAFVRRCLVLQLGWPAGRAALIEALVGRGRAHFPLLAESFLRTAAEMVAEDREAVADRGLCPPGGAEYLDLLRAVVRQWPDDPERQNAGLGRIRAFALRKHPEEFVG